MPDTHSRRSLVNQVDGLIRQKAVGYITCGQVGRGAQRLITYLQAVMLFVAFLDAAQYLQRLVYRWLLNQDRLEAAFQGGVPLHVFAKVVKGCRADALQLAAPQ